MSCVARITLGLLLGSVLTGCSLEVSIKDMDSKPAPTTVEYDPKLKASPGRVDSKSATMGLRATVTPTEGRLYGSSVRAKVSIGSQSLAQ